MGEADYDVRTSTRRTRTMTAFREQGRLVVLIPEHMSARQRRELIPGLVNRFLAKEARQAPPRADAELTRRAIELFETYLTPRVGYGAPTLGVRWVSTMAHRWGSCTTSTGEIRLSDRLREMPGWVVDYVILHEVAHLVEHDHSARFWDLVNAHPDTQRARGFLEGVDYARSMS